MNDYVKMSNNLRILYADNNLYIRNDITKILNMFFKEVIIARDGIEALEYFKKVKIDIVLADCIIPMVSGECFISEIRKIDKEIPIIITSSNFDKEKLIKAIDLQVIKYIEKPVNLDLLKEAISKSIDKLQLLNRLQVDLGDKVQYDYIRKVIINPNNLEIKLTKQEISLLELFIKNKTNIVYKHMIIEDIFNSHVEENTIRNLIYRIRKKLSPKTIETVKDLGYKMS
ncbi:MAG: response regulator transcription factor [Halarcobacter sp.]